MKHQITVPKPCHENWNRMTATQKGKFCNSCNKEVIDFTKLTDLEITNKISKGSNICGRFKEAQLDRDLNILQKSNISKVVASLALVSVISVTEPIIPQTNIQAIEVVNKQGEIVFISKNSKEKFITIKGNIRDKSGSLPSVSILLKESNIGVETDFDGNFSIKIPNKKRKSIILIISYLGYKTEEINVLSIKKPLIVEMKEDENILGEVITVGMVSYKKASFFQRCLNVFRKKENKRY